MVRHNNVVPNGHFHKKWQFYVKTWFNQPARKERRRKARADKAKAVFPRPSGGVLKPIVRCPSVRYNSKQRLGRGYTLTELKEAGIPVKFAPSIGIAVDHRRKNRSLETLQANVARLKAYRSNVVIFPRNVKKPKAFETALAEARTVPQFEGAIQPITVEKPTVQLTKVTKDMKDFKAYAKLRVERMNARVVGLRAKKAKEAAKEAEQAQS